ncbi:SHOCT domain-containing protein [Arthrobacter sp. HLT1-20]
MRATAGHRPHRDYFKENMMAFGRRNRPSLLGTAARTAVIAGTATAASNAVNAKAAGAQAAQQQAAEQAVLAQQAQLAQSLPVPVAAAPADDLLSKLERLAALHASGALTDSEFAAVKASIIS